MAKGSSNTILLLGAAGVAVYGYMQGWFGEPLSFFGNWFGSAGTGTGGSAALAPTTQQKAVIDATKAAATGTPALGTPATSTDIIAAQAAANFAYIVPTRATISQAPSGYSMIKVTDTTAAPAGWVYLRNDIAKKDIDTANADINAVNAAAETVWQTVSTVSPLTAGPRPTPMSLYTLTSGTYTLPDLKSGVSGLSGLQDYLHMRTGRVRPVRVV